MNAFAPVADWLLVVMQWLYDAFADPLPLPAMAEQARKRPQTER